MVINRKLSQLTMKKVLFVFGTRPEAIKMAPIIRLFKANTDCFETKVCVTGQHREMLDQVLSFFEILPDYDLNLMRPNQNLFTLTSDILSGLKEVLEDFEPYFVFVHGDTTTSMAAAIASFYHNVKICHVEAGLRTYNKNSPFPEEINRQITARVADYNFAPTEIAKQNLLNENVNPKSIAVTGNTVIDALQYTLKKVQAAPSEYCNRLNRLINDREVILVTGHRRENQGDGFENICKALRRIAIQKSDLLIVYPVHMNPKVQEPVHRILSDMANVCLISPLNYQDFVWLMSKSKIIITDSGGVQEEAPSLGKPVLVIRNNTERPEAVEAGTVLMVGTREDDIVSETLSLLKNKKKYEEMTLRHNPYGDGQASDRIFNHISAV
jgi:UDP-N-acetylglucosamine 2-epimerase (non-hydrolysing)